MAAVSLVSFRQAMVGTPQLFGVAYFGDTLGQPVNPFSVMQEAAPQLCEDLPFLLAVPKENVVGISGHLYCIVPADENATVVVNGGGRNEEHEAFECDEVIYRSEKGEPILLLCNGSGCAPDTLVTITDCNGNVAVWQPNLDGSYRTAPLCDDDGKSLLYDFSPMTHF